MEGKWLSLVKEEHIPLGQYMFAFSIKAAILSFLGGKLKDDKAILAIKRNYDLVSEHNSDTKLFNMECCQLVYQTRHVDDNPINQIPRSQTSSYGMINIVLLSVASPICFIVVGWVWYLTF